MPREQAPRAVRHRARTTRADRLGFRLDARTKGLIERAANLEHRKLTDFCVTALINAAQQTIERHETLTLSERDRAAFFEVLMHPPKPSPRLARAFETERRRVAR
jgi:uncharacterized protein (DUF1778 family)/GNAT superfamily N-acetyltransferase